MWNIWQPMFPQNFTLGNCSPNLGLLASEDRVSELHSGTVRVLRLKSQHICVSLKFYFFPVHMSVVSACVCLCNTCMPVLSEPTRRRVSNPGDWTYRWLWTMGAWNWTSVFWKTSALNCWTITPVLNPPPLKTKANATTKISFSLKWEL